MRLVYSSAGSPFARKVRIVLAELGIAVEDDIRPGFRPVEELREINPNLSLPVLIDGSMTLFESNLIMDYLFETYASDARPSGDPPLALAMVRPEQRWEDAKTLATIETFADTMVNVRHFRGEGSTAENSRYMARQEARMNSCLDWLEGRITAQGFWPGRFSAMDIALICPLAYGEARGVVDWRKGRPKITGLFERMQARPSVRSTAEAQAG